jgi:CRP/FNR family transcriptional regulator, cyclic AMP receptor protein
MPLAKSINILAGAPKGLIDQLFAGSEERRLAPGDVLFESGDHGDGCYRLEQGLVKLVLVSPQGEERILTILSPGAIVGELSMIDGLPRSASVVAISDCALVFISRREFDRFTASQPKLAAYLVKTLAQRLRETDQALAAATFLSVKGRVARALLSLAECVGEEHGSGQIMLRHKLSQGDLAAMAGVARENVSRTLAEWRKSNVVTKDCPYYCIKDPDALAREMEFET